MTETREFKARSVSRIDYTHQGDPLEGSVKIQFDLQNGEQLAIHLPLAKLEAFRRLTEDTLKSVDMTDVPGGML